MDHNFNPIDDVHGGTPKTAVFFLALRPAGGQLWGYMMMGLVEYGFHYYHNEAPISFDELFERLFDFFQYGLRGPVAKNWKE